MRDLPAVTALLDRLKTNPSERLEGQDLEFKGYYAPEEIADKRGDLAEEIACLANSVGGTIIVGVADSSNVAHGNWAAPLIGITPTPDPVRVRALLQGRLRTAPEFRLHLSNIVFEDKVYLVVNVPRAVSALVTTSSGRSLLRDGRDCRAMSNLEIASAVKRLQTYDWSAEDLGLSADHVLDPVSIDQAKADFEERRGIDSGTARDYLESIGATQNGRLTKGGLLFLGTPEAIREYLGLFEFRFTWSTPIGSLVINDIWTGSLWDAIRCAHLHFERCNHRLDVEFRKETYPVDLRPHREALL